MSEVYVYYAPDRLPTLDSVPRGGLLYVDPYSQRAYKEDVDRMVWGAVVYNRQLSPQEIRDAELIAAPIE